MASEKVVMLTDATFDKEVLESTSPVLVDFYADWCAPCRMMAPVIDELAADYDGKVKVCKLDTDAHRDAASRYGISSIPTIILFKGGKPEKQFVGVRKKSEFKTVLDAVVV
jgi:thioredoxin 1